MQPGYGGKSEICSAVALSSEKPSGSRFCAAEENDDILSMGSVAGDMLICFMTFTESAGHEGSFPGK